MHRRADSTRALSAWVSILLAPASGREASPLQALRESSLHPLASTLRQRWGEITEQVLPVPVHYACRILAFEGSEDM